MKITDMQVFPMGSAWRTLIYIRLVTDSGLTGIGEASLTNREEGVLGYLEGVKRKHVLGSDPFNIEDLWMRMWRNEFWRGGVMATTAMSAVEIACWDIVGKSAGLPVYKLLGGRCHGKIKAYANGWYTVERKPRELARRVKAVLAKGYHAFKIDPFGPGSYELDRKQKILSIDIIAALRDAVWPDVEIMVEMHGRFSAATAAGLARELAPYRPAWLEEPVPPDNYDELKRVVDLIGGAVPVAAGERCYTRHGARDLLERGAIDVAQFDVTHCGGIMELKKMAAMADTRYVLVAPHNSQGPVCTAASVHAGFTITNLKCQEVFDDFADPHVRDAVKGFPPVVDGYILPPEKPGLGVDLDEAVIRANPMRQVFFNLWSDDWHMREAGGKIAKSVPARRRTSKRRRAGKGAGGHHGKA